MSTFSCPDCKNKVSEKAESCPKCGRVFTSEETKKLIKLERKTGSIGCAMFIIIAIVIFIFISGNSDKTKTPEPATATQADTSLQNKKMIGLSITLTEITNSINNYYRIAESGTSIKEIKKMPSNKDSINDVYVSWISENIGIHFVTRKNNKNVISTYIISVPKEKDDSFKLMLSMATIITTLSPQLSKEEKGGLLLELLGNKNGDLNENKSVVVKDIKYTFMSSEIAGIMFFAENKNDV